MMRAKNTSRLKCPPFLHGKTTAGYSLVMAVAMSALLLYTGLAFLKWQNASLVNGRRRVAEMQAFYTAQAAVIAHPISFLRAMRYRDSHFPVIYHFNNGTIPNMGRFTDAKIERFPMNGSAATLMSDYNQYICSAIGIVEYRDGNGRTQTVKRRARVRVRLKALSDFLYFSESEYDHSGNLNYFENGDTTYGKVHSNSNIGIHPGAVFYGYVTTAGRLLNTVGAQFYAQPPPGYRELVRPIALPMHATELRLAAATGGTWLESRNREETYGLRFNGSNADVWIWRTGTTSPFLVEPPVNSISIPGNRNYAIFCTGDLWVQGHITGRVGIGAEGSIRLMDNMVYSDCQTWPYIIPTPTNSRNYLTVVSEAQENSSPTDPNVGILIANTYANGREDSGNHFGISPGSQHRRDIALQGSYIALNGSFTFQEQNRNEGDESYVYRCPEHGTDERGIIYLTGSITQRSSNSLHRTNEATTGIPTGYRLSMRADRRFQDNPPPYTGLISESSDNTLVIGLWEDDAPRALQQGYAYEWSDPPPE